MIRGYARLLASAALAAFLLSGPVAAQDPKEFKEKLEGKDEKPKPTLPFKEIQVPATGYVSDVVFSHDGTKMAVGVDAIVVIWNVADGKQLVRMQLPEKQSYHRLVFAADDKTLVYNGREDPMVRIFDVEKGRQVREFPQYDPYKERREAARAAAELNRKLGEKESDYGFSSSFHCYSPDGTRMVYSSDKSGLDVIEVATGKVVLNVPDYDAWRSCTYSADGKVIAVHDNEKGIRLWDAATGKLLRILREDPRLKPSGASYVSFSRDGKFLASWCHKPNSLDVWDLQSGKRVCTVPAAIYFMSAQFSGDNQSILGMTAWSEIMLHNIVAEKRIHRFSPPEQHGRFAGFTRDEKKVVILGPTTGAADSWQYSLFVYDVPARFLDPASARIDDVPLENLWPDLTTDNDARLQIVLKAFRSAPKETVALFRKQGLGAAKEQQKEIEAWIAELDDDDYTRRDLAMKNLHGVAQAFTPLLQSRHKAADAGEIRNRLAFVLKQMSNETLPAPLVREARVVALLEDMATPEARELLGELAQGAPEARLTLAAKTALERLGQSKATPK